jgi:excisionase family DNA binding protein
MMKETGLNRQTLVSIGEASQILGVSEVTLRQWTDDRKVKAFITPGGHRRYSIDALERLIKHPPKEPGLKQVAAKLEETSFLHGEIAREFVAAIDGLQKLDDSAQRELAEAGRQMLHLVMRYVTDRSRRSEIMQTARDVGAAFGEILAKQRLPLTDSVSAFIMHREPMLEAVTRMLQQGETLNRRIAPAIPLVARIMDEALVSLVATHQSYQPAIVEEEGREKH